MIRSLLAAALIAAGMASPALAENMTKATEAMLAEAKLDPSVLAGLDKELAVPQGVRWTQSSKGTDVPRSETKNVSAVDYVSPLARRRRSHCCPGREWKLPPRTLMKPF